ncbi:hypothetical protein NC661_11480 [Aquibacillus koreensis]|uniref:Uncharacterized protein n=1 Tax=Aquibacillus koreensis TaxID=279446 RepID=A0A9X3WP46_9BACI|nr:hypothetical protein [Aquibacillus koreensis]MCT2535132.1 hypothetical protein [Aquibacillus koreensis]MDC3420991.1 hypothetical protein [Aquibacillus koreensis]
MRKVHVGIISVIALLLFAVIVNFQVDNDKPNSTVVAYEDHPSLDAHQVRIDDLYVEIPFRKSTVDIQKRLANDYAYIDITDQETGEVLFTYGESIGKDREQIVFREIKTDQTTVRVQALLDINKGSGMIIEVIDTVGLFDPEPDHVSNKNVFAGPNSSEFPSEQVSILALFDLEWGDPQDYQNMYEGYIVGVIKDN